MGSAVAEGMIKCGHEVIVYNRTAVKAEPLVVLGATAVPTAAEAIRSADASILVLTDGKAVAKLLTDEVLDAVSGKKILNASTTASRELRTLHNRAVPTEAVCPRCPLWSALTRCVARKTTSCWAAPKRRNLSGRKSWAKLAAYSG
jgi:3-hydroxyisobutyrate dehydrogenase-like beta-hydroxyacid dehydrogenase